MTSYDKIWDSVLEIIKENTTPISFETWFKPLKIRKIDNSLNIVYIEVNSDKGKEFIISTIKNRYMTYLQNAFKTVLNDEYRVVLKDSDEYDKEEAKDSPVKVTTQKKALNKQKIFNPKFNFDNFVVGGSNKYAHAAALAVAESPSEAYNPLFIYGGSGLGKTHLMHAIGIYLLEKNPNLNVLYVSSEMFTNELIRALGEQKMNEFKSKYRKADVLLIDDIQFIEGKESTQEEFFYTFNTLYDSNRQIIISSDRAPNKLVNLDDRLKSRFQWNLIADIQPPDYETRVAILMKKAENMNIESVNINELLELILKRLKPIAAKHNIELVLESSRAVNAEIDETKLTLAISNLVENAIKYNLENGWVRVSLNADHKYFYVTVSDSGKGIPEESIDHIFERFYRVDKSHSTEIEGTGLGLAITRSAILMHHGAIRVRSKENEGTTFSVRIPLTFIR